jgi:four helix bundle protein
MGDFRKLDVRQRAHALALGIYQVTDSFPKHEQYGLASQMRSAALSMAANIVEGSGRLGDREFQHFLRISIGSAAELEYFLVLARDLKFLEDSAFSDFGTQLHAIRGMLVNLQRTVARSRSRTRSAARS